MVISAREALEERRVLSSSPDDDKTRAITSGVTSEKTTTFVRSSAENLRFLENGSVDLVIAGTSSLPNLQIERYDRCGIPFRLLTISAFLIVIVVFCSSSVSLVRLVQGMA